MDERELKLYAATLRCNTLCLKDRELFVGLNEVSAMSKLKQTVNYREHSHKRLISMYEVCEGHVDLDAPTAPQYEVVVGIDGGIRVGNVSDRSLLPRLYPEDSSIYWLDYQDIEYDSSRKRVSFKVFARRF